MHLTPKHWSIDQFSAIAVELMETALRCRSFFWAMIGQNNLTNIENQKKQVKVSRNYTSGKQNLNSQTILKGL